jgi:hypothetical protein
MDSLVKGIVILVLVILKLLITGFCLAIGFKLGYLAMDKANEKIQKHRAGRAQTVAA